MEAQDAAWEAAGTPYVPVEPEFIPVPENAYPWPEDEIAEALGLGSNANDANRVGQTLLSVPDASTLAESPSEKTIARDNSAARENEQTGLSVLPSEQTRVSVLPHETKSTPKVAPPALDAVLPAR